MTYQEIATRWPAYARLMREATYNDLGEQVAALRDHAWSRSTPARDRDAAGDALRAMQALREELYALRHELLSMQEGCDGA